MFLNMGPPELGISCSMAECLELAKSAGFAGIDVDIYQAKRLVAEKGSNYIRDLFSEKGLQIGGWIWFDHFGFSDDEPSFREQLEALRPLHRLPKGSGRPGSSPGSCPIPINSNTVKTSHGTSLACARRWTSSTRMARAWRWSISAPGHSGRAIRMPSFTR